MPNRTAISMPNIGILIATDGGKAMLAGMLTAAIRIDIYH
jgi:hypothetical protein